MKEFKRILFPVDLSESSTKIVPYVQAVTEKFEAKIYILFAARVFDYFTSMYVPYPSISSFEKEIIEGAEKRLYEFMDEHFSKFPNTKTAVVAGDASEEILNYIEDKPAIPAHFSYSLVIAIYWKYLQYLHDMLW